MKLEILSIACLISVVLSSHAAENNNLPNVLIIGDSISIGYTKPLTQMLKDKANVIHNPKNAQDSGYGLKNLKSWLGDTKWDVVHFNHGLHDLKYVDEKGKKSNTKKNSHIKISLEQYEKNMDAIVGVLKQTGAKLIFATTTPFPAGVKPLRIPEDVNKYNAVALKVMKKHQVSVNDLHAFVSPKLAKLQIPKNVHFTAAGSKVLAEEVKRHIVKAIGEQK